MRNIYSSPEYLRLRKRESELQLELNKIRRLMRELEIQLDKYPNDEVLVSRVNFWKQLFGS